MKHDHHLESLKHEWKKRLEAGTTRTIGGSLKHIDIGTTRSTKHHKYWEETKIEENRTGEKLGVQALVEIKRRGPVAMQ